MQAEIRHQQNQPSNMPVGDKETDTTNVQTIIESSECFRKGTCIELCSGVLRRVEDIRTEDFIQSAMRSQLFDLKEATVVRIDRTDHNLIKITFSYATQHLKVNMEVLPGHPLFVYGQGWASCNPQLSFELYELKCQQLQVGDICLSLMPLEQAAAAAPVPHTALAVMEANSDTTLLRHPYELYAEMANIVAAYTQHLIGKMTH